MSTETENKLINEINKLKEENEQMNKIATKEGFFREYFNLLKNHTTKENAFDHLNNQYEKYFGEKRFLNFDQFKKSN